MPICQKIGMADASSKGRAGRKEEMGAAELVPHSVYNSDMGAQEEKWSYRTNKQNKK